MLRNGGFGGSTFGILLTFSLGCSGSTKRKVNSFPQFLHSTAQRNELLTTDRTHSDTVCFVALAATSIAFVSSAVKRTWTTLPFVSPLGSLGRPAFFRVLLCWLKASRLLHDGRAYRVLPFFSVCLRC